MIPNKGLSPGVINDLAARIGFRLYFRFGVRKLIAVQLNHFAEHNYGWWAVDPRLSNYLKKEY